MRRLVAALTAGVAVAAAAVATLVPGAPAGAVVACPPNDAVYAFPPPVGPPAAATIQVSTGPAIGYATVGRDGRLYWYATFTGGSVLDVTAGSCLDGGGTDSPALSEDGDGITFFVRAPTGRIYERHLVTRAGGEPTAQGWVPVPGTAASAGPAVSRDGEGVLHLFFRGTDGRLKHLRRFAARPWSPVEDFGGAFVGVPATGRPALVGLTVVVRSPDGGLYARTQTAFRGPFGPWTRLAGTTSASPSVAGGPDGPVRLQLFVTGTTGGLYQAGWTGTGFGPFRKVDGFSPAGTRIAAAADDQLLVYARITAAGGVSTGLTLNVPDLGWSQYFLAPYTYPEYVPGPFPTAGGTARAALLPLARPTGGR